MFINGILYNSEVWYGLSRAEVSDLEHLDRNLLPTILKTPVSSPIEALYLELFEQPIGEILKMRRIMYLHHLVTRMENEMLYQFFITKWTSPTKGDWSETVKENLKEYGTPEDLEFIGNKTKYSFMNLINKRGKENTLLWVEQSRTIFSFRTRMTPIVENYRGNRDTIICPLCKKAPDNQDHSFQCEILTEKVGIRGINMGDIYNNNITLETAEVLTQILSTRKYILQHNKKDKETASEAQVHPILECC